MGCYISLHELKQCENHMLKFPTYVEWELKKGHFLNDFDENERRSRSQRAKTHQNETYFFSKPRVLKKILLKT